MDVLDIERDTRYLLEDLARAKSDILGRFEEFELRVKVINQSSRQILAVAGYRQYAKVWIDDMKEWEVWDVTGQNVYEGEDLYQLAPDDEHGMRCRVVDLFYDLPANQKEATIYRKE